MQLAHRLLFTSGLVLPRLSIVMSLVAVLWAAPASGSRFSVRGSTANHKNRLGIAAPTSAKPMNLHLRLTRSVGQATAATGKMSVRVENGQLILRDAPIARLQAMDRPARGKLAGVPYRLDHFGLGSGMLRIGPWTFRWSGQDNPILRAEENIFLPNRSTAPANAALAQGSLLSSLQRKRFARRISTGEQPVDLHNASEGTWWYSWESSNGDSALSVRRPSFFLYVDRTWRIERILPTGARPLVRTDWHHWSVGTPQTLELNLIWTPDTNRNDPLRN